MLSSGPFGLTAVLPCARKRSLATKGRQTMQSHSYGRILAALTLVLLLSGCGPRAELSPGPMVSEERAVVGVQAVNVAGSGTLVITRGEREALTVEAGEAILPQILTEVRDGTLVIDVRDVGLFRSTGPIVYRLTVTELHAIEASGSTEVEAADLSGDTLTVRVAGSSDVHLAGAVGHQEVTVSGSGDYRAEGLLSDVAVVDVRGSGDATVRVRETLDVTIGGSGEVRYLGAPRITQEINGSGDLTPLTETEANGDA